MFPTLSLPKTLNNSNNELHLVAPLTFNFLFFFSSLKQQQKKKETRLTQKFTHPLSFQSLPIAHNTKRTIMSSDNLALQAVSRFQAGNYTCVASNVEGDGESNVVELKVMCKYIRKVRSSLAYFISFDDLKIITCSK